MNNMRKLLGLVMGVAIVAFALPSVAGNDKKQYSLQMQVLTSPPAAEPFEIQATLTNLGNSTVSSFELAVSGMTIVNVVPFLPHPDNGQATVSSDGSMLSVTKMSPLKSGKSFVVTLYVSSCGDGQWGAAVWTGAKLNGQMFNEVPEPLTNLETDIVCDEVAAGHPFTVPDFLNSECITGQRGYHDKNGFIPAPTATLPIFVTNFTTSSQVHFRWAQDISGDPAAAFEYTVCAPGSIEDVNQDTQVAWLNTLGDPATSGTPVFITAQDCEPPIPPAAPPPDGFFLPAPYGS